MPWNDPLPYKDRARIAVRNAVRSGTLIKPEYCSACGTSGLIHAHHDDYDKPLSVRWLCPECHKERHDSINKYGIDSVLVMEDIYRQAVSYAKELIITTPLPRLFSRKKANNRGRGKSRGVSRAGQGTL